MKLFFMKKIFISVLALILSGFSFGQQSQPVANLPVDPDTKLIMFREVVNQEGKQDILYDRGASWFSSFYKSPVSVLKIQDKVNGKIEGNGRFSIYYFDEQGNKRDGGIVAYDIKLELKENKFRYTLVNFNLKTTSKFPLEKWLNKSDPAYNQQWDVYLYQVDTTMQSLVRNLKEGMKPKVIKKDEW
jgi:hypothetical protein